MVQVVFEIMLYLYTCTYVRTRVRTKVPFGTRVPDIVVAIPAVDLAIEAVV